MAQTKWLAYHTAVLTRVKRMPDFNKYMGIKPPGQTAAQVMANFERLERLQNVN